MSGYMKKRGIAFDYQNKIRKYLDSLYGNQNNNRVIEQTLIDQLSVSLKQELLIRSNGKIVERFAFLKNNFSEECLKKISLALKNKNYFPEEIIDKVIFKLDLTFFFFHSKFERKTPNNMYSNVFNLGKRR